VPPPPETEVWLRHCVVAFLTGQMHFSLALALPQKGHRPTYESQFKCHFVLHVHIGNVLKSNLLQSV